MDKHKALIEKVADVQIEVANDLARRMLSGETFKTRYVQLECAKAAINAVCEALKEPSEEMIDAAWKCYGQVCTGIYVKRANVSSVVAAALSSSQLGKGE